MNDHKRDILKILAAALLGLTLIPLMTPTAEAARFRGGWGRGWGRGWGGNRFYGGAYRGFYGGYPRYGYGYGYGYGGFAPNAYNRGYYGYYGGGYPYGYGGFAAPLTPAIPSMNYAFPMN
jgi:hypothetical protein